MDRMKACSSLTRSVYEWLEELVWAIAVVVIVFSFFFRIVTVNMTSMEPNYEPNDRLIVTCLSGKAAQGDVAVIVGVLEDPIIKRVIATEGQKIDINWEEGVVYVDDQPLDEARFGLKAGVTTPVFAAEELTQLPQVVPKGHVFVLGDHRTVSEDSRFASVGMVDVRKILGNAVFRLFPFDKFGSVI